MSTKQQALLACKLCEHFLPDELDKFIHFFESRTLDADVPLIEQGSKPDGLYIVESGSVKVMCQHESLNKSFEMCRLYQSDFFGETALLDGGTRSASVITLEPCRILFLDKATLSRLSADKENANLLVKFTMSLAASLATRLRNTNALALTALKSEFQQAHERHQKGGSYSWVV